MNILEKLQYDSYYKFIVSLGVIIFFAPVILFSFLITNQNSLVQNINNLSTSSNLIILKENTILSFYVNHMFIISIIFFIIGFLLVICGLKKWRKIQKELDKQIFLSTTSQSLGIQLQEKEINEKIFNEAKEDKQITSKEIKSINNANQSKIHNLLENIRKIEKHFLNYLTKQYPSYNFEQNIKIGSFVYDIIGVSKTTNIDYIYEIKHWKLSPSEHVIKHICNKIKEMCYEYETIRHRNCKPMLIIISQNKLSRNINPKLLSTYGITTYFLEEKEILSNNIKLNI